MKRFDSDSILKMAILCRHSSVSLYLIDFWISSENGQESWERSSPEWGLVEFTVFSRLSAEAKLVNLFFSNPQNGSKWESTNVEKDKLFVCRNDDDDAVFCVKWRCFTHSTKKDLYEKMERNLVSKFYVSISRTKERWRTYNYLLLCLVIHRTIFRTMCSGFVCTFSLENKL